MQNRFIHMNFHHSPLIDSRKHILMFGLVKQVGKATVERTRL